MRLRFAIALALVSTTALSYIASVESSVPEPWSEQTDGPLLTPEGHDYEAQILPIHNKLWPEVVEKCIGQAQQEGVATLDAVMAIDASGRVADFKSRPSGENFRCFRNNMIGKGYLPPPHAPFYVRFSTALDDRKY